MGGRALPMWVKICGVTTPEDAGGAVEAGADAIGLNFVAGPRKIDLSTAQAILEAIPDACVPVALATLASGGLHPDLNERLTACGVRHLQLYGEVAPANVARLIERALLPLIPCTLHDSNFRRAIDSGLIGLSTHDVFALLLDAHRPDRQGGTGRALDWDALAAARDRGELDGLPPIMLAGGLGPNNVARAIELVRPWGVDVSSGVERRPGRKDRRAMIDFVRAAKEAGAKT